MRRILWTTDLFGSRVDGEDRLVEQVLSSSLYMITDSHLVSQSSTCLGSFTFPRSLIPFRRDLTPFFPTFLRQQRLQVLHRRLHRRQSYLPQVRACQLRGAGYWFVSLSFNAFGRAQSSSSSLLCFPRSWNPIRGDRTHLRTIPSGSEPG